MNWKLTTSVFLIFLVSTPIIAKSEKIKIFFDKDWMICKPENAAFYRIGNWNDNLDFYDREFADFHMNNSLVTRGNYENKNKSGLFTFYDENGAKKLVAIFTDDKPSGIWNWYFPNEQIHFKIEFEDDEFNIIELNSFNGNSILENETVFTHASLNYFENYSLLIEGKLVNGQKDGKWKTFLNRKNLGYDLYKDGKFIKSRYNVEVPSKAKPKVVNNFLFIPKSITEIEKLNLRISVTDSDYHFLSFMFPWEEIEVAAGLAQDSNVFVPDQKPMYLYGMKGLVNDISMNMILGMEVIKHCKNWGIVYYELILDENGKIVEKNILKTPDEMLSKIQLESLKYIEDFKPAYHEGSPVKSRILMRQKYTKPTIKKKY